MNTFSTENDLKLDQPFKQWQKDPTPQTTGQLLTALQPSIDKGIHAYGAGGGPLIRSHARKLALQSLKTYDPARASLPTHVINHLQGLKRIRRKQTHILRTPDRVMLDRGRLRDAETELEDLHGRPPTTQQLADYTGISAARIAHVRKFQTPVAEGVYSTRNVDGGSFGSAPAVDTDSDSWLKIVYTDMNPINQKIMEWTYGLYGEPKLTNNGIAARLGITPSAVSQRKAGIQLLLSQSDLSPF